MAVEAPVRKDTQPIPEKERLALVFAGLYPRFLQGNESLNPSKIDLPQVTLESLGNIDQRNYGLIAARSIQDRGRYWQRRGEANFDRQKQIWLQETTDSFRQGQNFFTKSERGRQWGEVFSRLGINAAKFTDTQAQALYDKYFGGTNPDQKLKQFVKDIISSPNFDISKDMAAIHWIANIFGENSALVITLLSDAEKQLQENPQKIVDNANTQVENQLRINNLNPDEIAILNFLYNGEPFMQPAEPARPTTPPVGRGKQEIEINAKTPAEVAEALIDYQTGEIKNQTVDLRASYVNLLKKVEAKMAADDPELDQGKPIVILSDVAQAMIDRIAQESNNKDGELSFVLQGIFREHKGQKILVGAYPVPAMDYTKTEKTKSPITPEIYAPKAIALAKNTRLDNLYHQLTNTEEGASLAMIHIHQATLGPEFKAKPSTQDYAQIEQFLKRDPNTPQTWGVVTKDSTGLYENIVYSSVKNGQIVHKEHLPIIVEGQLVSKPATETPSQTAEKATQAQEIVPQANIEANKKAVDQFIRILRDPNRFRDIPSDPTNKMHELGHRLRVPLEESWFYINDTLDLAGNRYKMPMALYVPSNHAMLVLKSPQQEPNGSWKMKVYNPFKTGEREIILPQYDPNHPLGSHIYTNRQSNPQLREGTYDLTVEENPQFKHYQEIYTEGKLAALQTDGKNCVPYTMFVAAMLNALKPGDTEYKIDGIPQFRRDFNIKIKTLEEMLGQN